MLDERTDAEDEEHRVGKERREDGIAPVVLRGDHASDHGSVERKVHGERAEDSLEHALAARRYARRYCEQRYYDARERRNDLRPEVVPEIVLLLLCETGMRLKVAYAVQSRVELPRAVLHQEIAGLLVEPAEAARLHGVKLRRRGRDFAAHGVVVLHGRSEEPPLFVQVLRALGGDGRLPGAARTVDRDAHAVEDVPPEIAKGVYVPRAAAFGVAQDDVVGPRDALRLEPLRLCLRRPLRVAGDEDLVHVRDKEREDCRDSHDRLRYRQETDAARAHCDDLRMPAEHPHRVERREHKGRRRKIVEVRGKVAAEVERHLPGGELRLDHARERARKLEKHIDRDKTCQTVE